MTCLTRLFCPSLILTGAVMVCMAAAAQGQTPDAKSKATGAVSGRVTIGAKPAPGILITAAALNQSTFTGQATSDADGNYHIGGLSAGQVMVSPAAPLYVLPNNPMYGPGKVVNLSAGETVDGIDFKLTRGAVITGRVKDADGRPVIEERITLTAIDDNGAPSRQPAIRSFNYQMYQTDDRGVYRIYGVPAGHYKVSVGDEAGSFSGLRSSGFYQRTYYPDVTDAAKASIVDLNEGGEARDIDISLGRRAATYVVSGRIIDADTGKPLPGVPFGFGIITQNQNQSYISGSSSPGTLTNSQGEFRFEGVAPGHYGAFVSSDRFNFNPNANTGPSVYSEPVLFEVIDSDITDLEIKAQPGLSLSGVVVADGITDKKALARLLSLRIAVNVSPLSPTGTRLLMGSGSSSAVGPDGSFRIEGLRPGKASINLIGGPASDPKGFSITRIEPEGAPQNQGIDLQPGQNAAGVRVYLSYGTGVVRGQVKVEGGTLPGDVLFFVSLMRDGMPSRSMSQVDSRGQFLIENLAAGTYEIAMQFVSLGGPSPLPRGIPRQLKQSVTITDGAESEVVFTLNLNPKDGQ